MSVNVERKSKRRSGFAMAEERDTTIIRRVLPLESIADKILLNENKVPFLLWSS